MVPIRRLLFADVAPGRDFHVALVMTHPRRPQASLHTHDFGEMMYILEGDGVHWVNGRALPIRGGDLLWVRPDDTHTVCARPAAKLHFVNVAFAAAAWADFRRTAGLEDAALGWDAAPLPVTASVPPERRDECARVFTQALRAFHGRAARLDLCHFWAGALTLLLPDAGTDPTELPDGSPLWLRRACTVMGAADNLRAGLPRLVELCGVSPAHLSRTLRAARGTTPTEFILNLRLSRAATLLLTTSQEVADIALDCGFENLSYFYRRFRRSYGRPPHAYRQEARRRVLPGG